MKLKQIGWILVFFLHLCGVHQPQAGNSIDASVQFLMPTLKYPFYAAVISLSPQNVYSGKISQLKINGNEIADIFVFNGETESFQREVHPNQTVRILTRCDWRTGHVYQFEISFHRTKSTLKIKNAANAGPGYWNGLCQKYVTFIVEEKYGLTRTNEPVFVTLGLLSRDIREPLSEIRVILYQSETYNGRGGTYTEVPFQIISVQKWENEQILSLEKDKNLTAITQYDATTTVELMFLASTRAHQSNIYLIFYSNKQPPVPFYKTELKVRGIQGHAFVSNKYLMMGLTDDSKALENITLIGEEQDYVFENLLPNTQPLHWNPDVLIPPAPWSRASAWEKPLLSKKNGSLYYRLVRHAPMGPNDEIQTSITYEMFEEVPYLLVSSTIQVTKATFVKALRNNHLMFTADTFDELVWQETPDRVERLPLANTRPFPETVKKLPAHVKWLGFVDNKQRVGLAAINIAFNSGNSQGEPALLEQPHFIIGTRPWQYWSRALIFPMGTGSGTRVMPVHQGSYYYEKFALYPFEMGATDAPFAKVQMAAEKLLHPLNVFMWMPNDPQLQYPWDMYEALLPQDKSAQKLTEE